MEIKRLSCPLCLQPNFENVDSLRTTLISAATSHLSCPVCNETLLGLDKLTIHLFCHINNNSKNKNISNESQETVKIELPAGSSSQNDCQQEKIIENKNERSSSTSVQDEINKSINKIKKDHCNEKIKHEAKPNLNIIRCDICNFCFTDQNILDMHQKLLHQTPPDKKTGQYSYHCHLCSKKFKMRGSLMVHLRVAHYGFTHNHQRDTSINNLTDINNIEELKTERRGGKNNENNKQWACDVCSKLFTTKYFLKKHKRLHTGEMPYSCAQCNKSFTFQQSYHKHMLYHSTEKPYSCNECGRAFKELSTLQNHQRIHSGERPFACENCGKKFRQRVSYLVHRRIHTGVMPYKCTACNKTFRYKVSQRSHKCPMNPPGSVVKIPESMDDSNSVNSQDNSINILSTTSPSNSINNNVKCIMSVDYSTGNINFFPEQFSNESQSQQIHISYNKVDLDANSAKETLQKTDFAQELNLLVPPDSGEANDLFSVVMSPLLPEVASLCLSNDSPLDNNTNNNNGNHN